MYSLIVLTAVVAVTSRIDRKAVLLRNNVKFSYPDGKIDPKATAHTQYVNVVSFVVPQRTLLTRVFLLDTGSTRFRSC